MKLLLLEIVAFGTAVVGLALLSVPLALIVGGAGVVAACEVRGGDDQ